MKTNFILVKVLILFLLLMIFPFSNLYSQYFIGQSQIDEFKLSKKSYYLAPKSQFKDKYVYLYQIEVDGYLSSVRIGFNKERYKNGEPITVTLKLGNESKEDSVEVIVYGGKVSSKQVKINGGSGQTPLNFRLSKGDNVKIVIDCGGYNPNINGSIIDFQINNIQRSPAANEWRQYDIIYDKNPTEQEKRNRESRKGRVIKRVPVVPNNSSTRKFPD